MKPEDFCPFDPTEPRCRECRGKPCGDEGDADGVPPKPVTDEDFAALPVLDLSSYRGLGD